MEKEQKEDTRSTKFDIVITSQNFNILDSFKRMIRLVREKEKVNIGMTRQNEWIFYKMLDIVKDCGMNIRVIEEIEYNTGIHDGVCKVVHLRK